MIDPTAAVANQMLERESWARQRLAVHAGRTFVLVATPVVAPFRISDTGLLEPYALADGPADLRLAMAPWAVPGLLADPSRWDTAVTSEGDPALAATLRELAQTAPFWIEQFLARWLGPIAGQRLADAGRQMLGMPNHAADRLGESVASYLRDQTSLVAGGAEARAFAQQTATLAQRVNDVELRIDALSSRLPP
jgi:ubiquinone biosynthesis protein UbiJ